MFKETWGLRIILVSISVSRVLINMHILAATTLLSASLAAAYDLPDNLKTIYDNHKACIQESEVIWLQFADVGKVWEMQ